MERDDRTAFASFLIDLSFFCVQKVHVRIQKEVAARKGVNDRAAVVRTLQIAGEPGERSFRMPNCWIWRQQMKGEHFSDSKKSKKETDRAPEATASQGETLSLSVEETE